jgi:hypothetical protein
MLEMTGKGFAMFDVDLRREEEIGTASYSVKLSIASEPKSRVSMYFPNTNHDKDKIIECHKYKRLSDLDKSIEQALQNTKISKDYLGTRDDRGLKMAIRDHDMNATFKIWGVRNEHTYYLYWLSIFNRYNAIGYVGDPLTNIPVLFEMDGMGTVLNVVALHNQHDILMPLNLSNVTVPTCSIIELFTCERSCPKPESGHGIQTTVLKEAEYRVRNISLDQEILSIEIPYEEDEKNISVSLILNDNKDF